MMASHAYELVELHHVNTDIIALTVQPTLAETGLQYQPGQYVMATVQDIHCPLSIANAPRADQQLVFHLRHNASQPQAEIFLHYLKENLHLALSPAMGQMHLNHEVKKSQHLVLLAGGTGIAPFQAILESLWKSQDSMLNNLRLFWGVRKLEDLYLNRYLEDIKGKYPGFEFNAVLSDPARHPDWQGPTGWAHDFALRTLKDPLNNLTVFASGPFEMVQNSQSAFVSAGLPKEQFVSDMLDA